MGSNRKEGSGQMKRVTHSGVAKTALIISLLLTAGTLLAQAPEFSQAGSDYYRVFYTGPVSRAQNLARQLDAYGELFEEYLHFERTGLKEKPEGEDFLRPGELCRLSRKDHRRAQGLLCLSPVQRSGHE